MQQSEDAPTKSQAATLSKALASLELRELVTLYDAAGGVGFKRRTTRIRLTRTGKETAEALVRSKGLSQRELREQSSEYASRRALWNLRRLWKQSQVDYRYAMHIFKNVATHLAYTERAQSAAKLPYPEGYDEDHHHYMDELEDEIAKLELLLGEPHKSLTIPDNWKSDGGFYKDKLESLPKLESIERLVPF